MSNRLIQLELFHLRLPFRHSFSHAAAQRNTTDTVIVGALLADGTVGFGEALPRSYVTGETVESVFYNIQTTLAPYLRDVEPKNFAELLELVDNLPFTNEQEQVINSARCCVELALLDAYGKYFKSDLSCIIGWMGYGPFFSDAPIAKFGPDTSARLRRRQPPPVSGVLDGSEPDRLARQLCLMRWYGLRDFKLKLGCRYDQENLQLVHHALHRPLEKGRVSLRVDANGAWDVDTATAMGAQLADLNVCCLEQPLAVNDRDHWHVLADLSQVPLMADESLISLADGQYLAENDLIDFFNIRISKNGGLLAAIRLAEMARRFSRDYQLGAMVGETGILAAAGLCFLEMVPNVIFTEICYGTFLLRDDIVQEKIRFGYAGRLPKRKKPGLAINVRRDMLAKFLVGPTGKIPLD